MSDLFGQDKKKEPDTPGVAEDQPMGLMPESPFLWPEHRVLAGVTTYQQAPAWGHLLHEARSICGMITELGSEGIDLLRKSLNENKELQAKFVLVLYPACRTKRGHLSELVALTKEAPHRFQLRLYLLPYIEDIPFHSMMIMPQGDGSRPRLLTGPAGNLGLEETRPDRVNLVTIPDAATVESWTRWFNWLWSIYSVRLRDDITGIPELVRPQGTEEARHMWESYMAACDSQEAPAVEIEVNPETGEIEAQVRPEELEGKTPEEQKQIKEEAQKKLPTVAMGVPRMDATADRIARLFQKGSLATIDKSTRVKPLTVPISPKFFGMESEERSGRVLQKTTYSVSIFDEEDQKAIENLRKSIGTLLGSLSYPIADGVRWVPDSAKELLSREISKRNTDAGGVLAEKVGDLDAFLKKIEPTIRHDAQKMYSKIVPGASLDDRMFEKVKEEIRLRMKGAMEGNLLPRITYMPVEFRPTTDEPTTSSWGSAYKLLFHIAKYPADVAKAGKFFERGFLDCRADEVVKGMDVLGHAWFRLPGGLPDYKVAADQWLPVLEEFEGFPTLLPEKCLELLRLIESGDLSALCTEAEP